MNLAVKCTVTGNMYADHRKAGTINRSRNALTEFVSGTVARMAISHLATFAVEESKDYSYTHVSMWLKDRAKRMRTGGSNIQA